MTKVIISKCTSSPPKCVQYERSPPWVSEICPERRLLVSRLFRMRDVGQKLGQKAHIYPLSDVQYE